MSSFKQLDGFNENHLASYLFYNAFLHVNEVEYRYHTIMPKEQCDKYNHEFENGHNTNGRPVHIDPQIVENWYPHTFSERIDKILIYISNHVHHLGQPIELSFEQALGLLFIDRKRDEERISYIKDDRFRDEKECEVEVKYMLDYLQNSNLINYTILSGNNYATIQLQPDGYRRVDELQKNTSNGRNVLVAMKFGDDTKPLREAIRAGIFQAGYYAVFIDEVQHNNFITPELLKHIRDSKFIVVDLTHQNNGAYFEEGYAMGLGKPVIQLCKQDTKLHFDIAQINTIMWQIEDDIPDKLCNRIKATID